MEVRGGVWEKKGRGGDPRSGVRDGDRGMGRKQGYPDVVDLD